MNYIKNGMIVMPDRVISGRVLSYDDKIRGIISESDIPRGAHVTDARGGYITAGFIDLHIHGYRGADASDGNADGIKTMALGIAENGVTSFLPTTMTVSPSELNAALDSVRECFAKSKSWNGAEILGVHAEGPFINPTKKGAQAEDNIQKPDADFIIRNSDIIRTATLAPEMDGGHACIKEIAAKTKIVMSIGHTDADYEETLAAFADGVSHSTHLYNAMSPMQHRKPGVVSAVFASAMSTEIIADTFHVHPGLFGIVAAIKGEKLILITDCTRAGGMPDGEYSLGGQPIYKKGIQCLLEDGTIAGSVLRLNEALRNMKDNTSLPTEKIVAMATLNPAKIIGEDWRIGSLDRGKDADIVLSDSDFNIKMTIKGGRTIYGS